MTISTSQQVFDTVVKHLTKQGKRATMVTKDGLMLCAYRTRDEEGKILKCAIGCLIPDDEYLESIETKSVFKIINDLYINTHYKDSMPKFKALVKRLRDEGEDVTKLLSVLQSAHRELKETDYERS